MSEEMFLVIHAARPDFMNRRVACLAAVGSFNY